jgi:hypothetical protein
MDEDITATIRRRHVSKTGERWAARTTAALPNDSFSNGIDLYRRWLNGEILPVARYGTGSASRKEVAIVAERRSTGRFSGVYSWSNFSLIGGGTGGRGRAAPAADPSHALRG